MSRALAYKRDSLSLAELWSTGSPVVPGSGSTLAGQHEPPPTFPSMARADLILSLVRAAVAGDEAELRAHVAALAADERAKRHGPFADKLLRALEGTASFGGQSRSTGSFAASPSPQGRDYLLAVPPRRRLDELTLSPCNLEAVKELLEEHFRADLLRSYGLQPRHRLLLAGPPGNGKTSLAESIAEALNLPFFIIRYDVIISSFLGETNERLKSVFDFAKTTPCVLLFDEFDAVGKERGDEHETGEIKRVVSSLILQVDALPSYVIAIAATNHEELLDRAVWRRFQIRLSLASPTRSELIIFLERQFNLSFTRSQRKGFAELGIASFAEAADFVLDVRRRYALSNGATLLEDAIQGRMAQWSQRLKAPNSGERSQPTDPDV